MADACVLYAGPLITRREAVQQGKKRYFTGRPCKYNHIDEWLVCGGCAQCQRIRIRKNEAKDTELRLRLAGEIAGRPRPENCEVCGNSGRIVFDHCHASGRFRGWLCDRCNLALGLARDNAATLRKLADYLEK